MQHASVRAGLTASRCLVVGSMDGAAWKCQSALFHDAVVTRSGAETGSTVATSHLIIDAGGKGGSDFDPKGKSDGEIMRFCQVCTHPDSSCSALDLPTCLVRSHGCHTQLRRLGSRGAALALWHSPPLSVSRIGWSRGTGLRTPLPSPRSTRWPGDNEFGKGLSPAVRSWGYLYPTSSHSRCFASVRMAAA